jgi:hypothetical protein
VVKVFKTDYPAYKEYLLNLGTKVSELNKMIKEYEKPINDSLKVELYAKYFKTSVSLIQYTVQASKLPYLKDIESIKNLETQTKKYFFLAYEVADLTTAINRKRYPEVVNHLINAYNEVLAGPSLESESLNANKIELTKKEKIALADGVLRQKTVDPNQTVASAIGAINEIQVQIKNKDDNANKSHKVLSLITKYGAFMANMIAAKNSEEVEQAIESVALPAGSASIKRETDFNVSLNAYCGLFYGGENIKGFDNGYKSTIGITAPIGISLNWGNSKAIPFVKNGHCAHTIFLSIFDIGAVTAFRFGDENTESVPKIELKDIISPGIFYSFGIPKCPISVNVGYQLGPLLRNVDAVENTYQNSYSRMSIGLVVDIPLLNLYTKSKND